jgi:phage tail sheath gpL-like
MGKKLYLTNGVSFGGKYTVTSGDVAVTAVAEVDTLTITNACTADGTITVTLADGVTDDIAVTTTTGSTVAEVAALIQAGTYTGWTATVDGAVVTFTATTAGAQSGTSALTVNSTGVAGTFVITTAGVDAVAGSVTFDCSSSYSIGQPVNYDMVASFVVLTSANVFVPLTDAVITYPSDGQIKISDGSTFKLTAGYIINVVAQRSNTITSGD